MQLATVGIDAEVLRFFRPLDPCLIGMEACVTSHYWARELNALGRRVKLIPPTYVEACIRRNKNDAADAEAICKAVSRPTMRFVPVKNVEQHVQRPIENALQAESRERRAYA